jgi:hypothetical protein
MKNFTRAAALLMFYFESTPEGLLVSNQYIGVHTSADVGGTTRIKPRWAQTTKEQRHEQEIYFGADADYGHGIRADGQLWFFHTGPAATQPAAAIDNQSIHLSLNSLNDRPDEFNGHQHE